MKCLFWILLLVPLLGFPQKSFKKQLDTITTTQGAIEFLKLEKPTDGELLIFNEKTHDNKISTQLFKLNKGSIKIVSSEYHKIIYKVINKASVDYLKFNIILVDGNTSSSRAARVIRDKVFDQYKEGYNFIDLVKKHSSKFSSDGNKVWLRAGMVSGTFDKSAFNEANVVNKAFTIDDLENNKFYIVLKLENKTPIDEIVVLKLKEEI